VIEFALKLSAATRGQPTSEAGEFASIAHLKMMMNAVSAERLFKEAFFFDHSAIMTLCRMIVETMTLYYYLRETVSLDEWECRKATLQLHATSARIKLFRASRPKEAFQDILDGRESLKTSLRANTFFGTLQKEQQDYIISGEQIYVGGMRAAAVRAAGWREEQFMSLYSYFSAHAHSVPMSFVRFRRHQIDYANPSGAQLNMVALALSVAEFCLLRVSMHHLTIDSADMSAFSPSELAEFREEIATSKILQGDLPAAGGLI
jgi:hypothetical protein